MSMPFEILTKHAMMVSRCFMKLWYAFFTTRWAGNRLHAVGSDTEEHEGVVALEVGQVAGQTGRDF
jgi:hypothetical protein